MKINVSKKNCKFYVDKEARTVVCVIPDTRFTFVRFIEKNMDAYQIALSFPYPYNDYYFPSSISAKAKCAPEDEWDEEFGRELAYQRAKEKFYRYFFNYAEKYLNFCVNQLIKCIRVFDDVQTRIEKNMAGNWDASEDNDE